MPKQIGIFVDVSNLYYCINKKFKDRKLDYQKYWDYIASLGDIVLANAYGAQVKNQAAGFLHRLKQIGFDPKYDTPKSFIDGDTIVKKADYDVKICVDILETCINLDIIVLGSADSDFLPLVQKLRELNKKVIIFACKISKDLVQSGETCVEIPESFLEAKYETTHTKKR